MAGIMPRAVHGLAADRLVAGTAGAGVDGDFGGDGFLHGGRSNLFSDLGFICPAFHQNVRICVRTIPLRRLSFSSSSKRAPPLPSTLLRLGARPVASIPRAFQLGRETAPHSGRLSRRDRVSPALEHERAVPAPIRRAFLVRRIVRCPSCGLRTGARHLHAALDGCVHLLNQP